MNTNTQLTTACSIQNISSDVQEFVDQFNQFSRKTAESIIGMAEIVYKAKKSLSDSESNGRFQEFCSAIRFKPKSSAIRKLGRIGEMSDLLKRHSDKLPNTWTTIYTLTHLGSQALEDAIEREDVKANITAAAAVKLLGKNSEKRQKTNTMGEDDITNDEPAEQDGYALSIRFDATPSPSLASQLEKIVKNFIERESMNARCLRSNSLDNLFEDAANDNFSVAA